MKSIGKFNPESKTGLDVHFKQSMKRPEPLLDITSHASNLVISNKNDPTLKELSTYHLFSPFINVFTFNSLAIDEHFQSK
ncbi:19430_t:CDS:2 [Entrophospora sp. SA101]|nr:2383_t:CDS:2 [Entrophospora sp. SA101]CAJ0835752.1 2384_t:CDS:2 [Entrophospora sp. SA101]CAJ0902273.1 21782_t:CDS:2 [Entrophospora sp. SA101]CAJ0910663.1 19430_t:CDS:2 [Entrophospora sp. SA101]